MGLKSLLNRIKERNYRGISKQTEQLDVQTRQHLQEFLEDVPEEQQELEELEEELHQANIKLQAVQEKEEFIATRLASYRKQLQQMPPAPMVQTTTTAEDNDEDAKEEEEEEGQGNRNDNINPPPPAAQQDQQQLQHQERQQRQQEKNLQALQKIETLHDEMVTTIRGLQKKVAKMERRKLQLQWHLEECQVVLNKTKDLDRQEMESAMENVVVLVSSDGGDGGGTNNATTTLATNSNNNDDDDVNRGGDEELGTVKGSKTKEIDSTTLPEKVNE
eukprot:scaffold4033_cov54-Cylindrotheca_fusiformis.AAC.1